MEFGTGDRVYIPGSKGEYWIIASIDKLGIATLANGNKRIKTLIGLLRLAPPPRASDTPTRQSNVSTF